MKYLIEVPDGTVYGYDEDKKILIFQEKDFIEVSEVSNLIYLPNVVPYEESDRKAIEDEVWKFAKKIGSFNGLAKRDLDECFGHTTIQGVMTTYDTYREAKREYEKWKESKEEIRVGDEVIYNSRTRAVVLEPETEKKYGEIFTSDSSTIVVSHDDLKKTGRHFDEVEELLKKMREGK